MMIPTVEPKFVLDDKTRAIKTLIDKFEICRLPIPKEDDMYTIAFPRYTERDFRGGPRFIIGAYAQVGSKKYFHISQRIDEEVAEAILECMEDSEELVFFGMENCTVLRSYVRQESRRELIVCCPGTEKPYWNLR